MLITRENLEVKKTILLYLSLYRIIERMKSDPIELFETITSKAKENPNFAQDLANYLKYLVLKYSPNQDIEKLNHILEEKDLANFINLGAENIPNFNERILSYIKEY